ncbi:UPF0236 family transposase-like protein [Veillonella sp. VA139]|uniref:UPF0236 family transposase-like protein n=1 Tax=Veillonella sp. VA139 TaxID=741830 RepID=UPI000F8D61DD
MNLHHRILNFNKLLLAHAYIIPHLADNNYKDKVTREFVYLLDALLDLPSHKRIEPYCASEIIKHAISMSYEKSAEASTPKRIYP